jgi:hypothetical protein
MPPHGVVVVHRPEPAVHPRVHLPAQLVPGPHLAGGDQLGVAATCREAAQHPRGLAEGLDDGRWDVLKEDRDLNGRHEYTHVDRNNNRTLEYRQRDLSGDGRPDRIDHDRNEDGRYDNRYERSDPDGPYDR